MSHWKWIVISVLSLFPILLFAGFGGWALYRSGDWFWLWWSLPVCWGLSSLLARWWSRDLQLHFPQADVQHWTPQDRAALAIVEAEQARLADLSGDNLIDPQFYTEITQRMALQIARHYRPNAKDPLGDRSVVEILAAMRLISEDVEELFIRYVPASHLVTVSQWKLLAHAPSWWQTASAVGWIGSIALNPLNIGRYVASKFAMDPLSRQVQQNILGAFYGLYVRQAGYYLIELNSGRLRAGSKRYREIMGKLAGDALPKQAGPVPVEVSEEPATAAEPTTITLAVIGQVKAGKSSLVNCLLGGQRAVMDILPATQSVTRYTLTWPERSERLVLLDTPGYSDAGATSAQLRETSEAVRQAQVYLLVLDVRSPARDADVQTLRKLNDWFDAHPRFQPPQLLVVLNKIDGLSPVMEWAPPYDWRNPTRPKEKNIAAARDYAREVFGSQPVEIVPVCADIEHQRQWGIQENLLPSVSQHLDAARAAALVRGLHLDFDRGKVRQVVNQVLEAGKHLFQSLDS